MTLSQKQPPPAEFGDFQPIDPWKSSELVVRGRKLPHLEVTGALTLLPSAVIGTSSFLLERAISQ
jgi:hypothetical protein